MMGKIMQKKGNREVGGYRTFFMVMRKSFNRLFWDRKFLYYTCISIFVTIVNIFGLWFTIDILDVPTLLASAAVIGATFILRYILLIFFKVF